jgi:hypothetical protein
MRVGRRVSEVPVVTLDGEVFLDARAVTYEYHPEFYSRAASTTSAPQWRTRPYRPWT